MIDLPSTAKDASRGLREVDRLTTHPRLAPKPHHTHPEGVCVCVCVVGACGQRATASTTRQQQHKKKRHRVNGLCVDNAIIKTKPRENGKREDWIGGDVGMGGGRNLRCPRLSDTPGHEDKEKREIWIALREGGGGL